MNTWVIGWIVACLAATGAAEAYIYISYARTAQAVGTPYFAAELEARSVAADVIVGHMTYHVERGVAVARGSRGNIRDTSVALRIAYAREIAIRSPILDMEGTDPSRLSEAADELAKVSEGLAKLQKSPRDKALVKRALYPTAFLHALAELERARKKFIASGRDVDEAAYAAQLKKTIRVGQENLGAFERAYTLAVDSESTRYATLGGIVTKESSLAALREIGLGFDRVSKRAYAREQCMQGELSKCNAQDLAIQQPRAITMRVPTEVPALVRQVLALHVDAGLSHYKDVPIVALSRSACINSFTPPYYFGVQTYPQSTDYPRVRFVGDFMFYPITRSDAAPLDPFSTRGASYLPYMATAYYSCPEGARDTARVRVVIFLSKLAFAETRSILRANTPENAYIASEADASRYLIEMLPSAFDPVHGDDRWTQNVVRNVYLMWKDNSAWFDAIVEEIAVFGKTELRMKEAGIPIDTSMSFLFSSRSGFYDLFLAHNPSAGSGESSPYASGERNPFLEQFLKWSDTRSTIPRADILNGLRVYMSVHKPAP